MKPHQAKSLSTWQMIAYSMGQLGWSTLLNIVYTLLVYFYLPPKNANLPQLISDYKYFGFINAIVFIAAFGRIMEAFTDPLIANWSDRSKFKMGRRTPFMWMGFIPVCILCSLMFMPPDMNPTSRNFTWLIVVQLLYYPAFTMYVIPYSALLIEYAHTEKERMNLATFTSLTYAMGSLTAALVPIIATVIQNKYGFDRIHGIQNAIKIMCVLSAVCFLMPLLFIKEREHSNSYSPESKNKTEHSIFESLKMTFKNPRFISFVIPDCMYWTGLNIITTGILYYLTVLLGLPEDSLTILMIVLLGSSFAFYPLVNYLGKRKSRKKLMQIAFVLFGFIFGLVTLLGKLPIPHYGQAVMIMVGAAIPFAFLGILPNTVLADIAEHDTLMTGERREGMFFAARTMVMKLGQTFGIVLFTILLSFGKDQGNDLGIRLSGLVGMILSISAMFIFGRYDEAKTLKEIEEKKKIA